jgi:hypothetical protein
VGEPLHVLLPKSQMWLFLFYRFRYPSWRQSAVSLPTLLETGRNLKRLIWQLDAWTNRPFHSSGFHYDVHHVAVIAFINAFPLLSTGARYMVNQFADLVQNWTVIGMVYFSEMFRNKDLQKYVSYMVWYTQGPITIVFCSIYIGLLH